jgi:hypothetical protein
MSLSHHIGLERSVQVSVKALGDEDQTDGLGGRVDAGRQVIEGPGLSGQSQVALGLGNARLLTRVDVAALGPTDGRLAAQVTILLAPTEAATGAGAYLDLRFIHGVSVHIPVWLNVACSPS